MKTSQPHAPGLPADAAVPVRIRDVVWIPALSQCIGMLTGILLTRLLPKAEFAWFTIGNTVVSFFATMIEGGAGLGMQSIGGRIWQDRPAFGRLLATALQLRWRLGLIAGLIALPVPIWLLLRNAASAAWTSLLILVNVAAFPLILTGGMLGSALKLTGEFRAPLAADLGAALLRLSLVLAFALLLTINAVLAALAATAALLLQNWLLGRHARHLIPAGSRPADEYRSQLGLQFRSLLPNAVFMFVQTQIGVWVLSITASVSVVADFGALARLASLFALISVVFYQIIIPGLARSQTASYLRGRLWQALGLYLLATALLVAGGWWFADAILGIFGPSYGHLTRELPWMLLCHGVYTFSAILWWFNTSRGWVLHAWLNPVLTILVQIVALVLFRPDTLMALIFYLFLTIMPSLLVALVEIGLGIRQLEKTSADE